VAEAYFASREALGFPMLGNSVPGTDFRTGKSVPGTEFPTEVA
jgi:hypothetical protein